MGEKPSSQPADDPRLKVFEQFIKTIDERGDGATPLSERQVGQLYFGAPFVEGPSDFPSQVAFRRRLENLNSETGFQISHDVLDALLYNEMTHQHSRELFDALVVPEELELTTQEQLDVLIDHIHQVLALVLDDPDAWFESNRHSKSIIVDTLKDAVDEINLYARPQETDRPELVDTYQQLWKVLMRFKKRVAQHVGVFPESKTEVWEAFEKIEKAIKTVPLFATTSPDNIRFIHHSLDTIFVIEQPLVRPYRLFIDQEEVQKILSAIKRLANGEEL